MGKKSKWFSRGTKPQHPFVQSTPDPIYPVRIIKRKAMKTEAEKKKRKRQKRKKKNRVEKDHESFADLAIQAESDRAMNIPNDDIDWLLP